MSLESLANVAQRVAEYDTAIKESSQMYKQVLSAWGECFDTSRSSGATCLHVHARGNMLILTDNGCGMSEADMLHGVISVDDPDLGYRGVPIAYTSGLMRLADHALVLSDNGGGYWTAGLISPSLSEQLGSTRLMVLQCTWKEDRLFMGTTSDCPLSAREREASLRLLLEHSPFKSEFALLSEFEAIHTSDVQALTGTRVVMLGVRAQEHDLTRPDDILIRGAPRDAHAHETSACAIRIG